MSEWRPSVQPGREWNNTTKESREIPRGQLLNELHTLTSELAAERARAEAAEQAEAWLQAKLAAANARIEALEAKAALADWMIEHIHEKLGGGLTLDVPSSELVARYDALKPAAGKETS